MNEYELLSNLQGAGVAFLVNVPDRGRTAKTEATPFDLIELLADPDRFFAKCHRVNKETYLSWTMDEFRVRCAHVENSIPCESFVANGKPVSARKYVELQGTMCPKHR